ncbi:ferredoxin [Desulfotomaculum copahuensis]|uniref:Ferredoxin n=1 Tax=Desulfotomaculum copahuensis TaxID=1838280 RepID=A0A1B7LCX4_9FIRM|nr:ferredoxin [Desulfotomaculum copahuensis]
MDRAYSTVDFEPVGRRVRVPAGQTILEAARGMDLFSGGGVVAPCGGKGLCGRCRVRVAEGNLSPLTEAEKRLLREEELAAGYRLACQAAVQGPVKVEIPPESLTGRQELQVAGEDVAVVPEPAVKRFVIKLQPTNINFPQPVWQQVERALMADYGLPEVRVDLELLRCEPVLAAGGAATVTVRGREAGNIFWSVPAPKPLGLAVDLGTTKVAGFLIDLASGALLAAEGIMNPQIAYGEDVMSRLAYALESRENYRRMTRVITDGLNRLLHDLAGKAGVFLQTVEEAVIVGNTAMHHLLLGLPVSQLARAPYVPAAAVPVEVKARELGLDMAPGAVAYLMPPVAGFVGGDHVAMILGSRIDEAKAVTLGLDIGTNTEIVLARGGEMLSCSCASGPAFEGAQIQQGMRAVDGAISLVRLSDGGGRVHFETIGGQPPLGICGSGVLDAVAELYREGVINDNGRLDRSHPRVRLAGEKKIAEYLLVPAEQSGAGHDLVLTQKDIGEIQLAKAAIAGGTKILLREAGLKEEDIEQVVVAGAFGTHLQLASALAIGMFPALPPERFRQVGNAAGTGARLALLSMPERRRAEDVARRVKYLELTAVPGFGDTFMAELRFPPPVTR